MVTLRCYLRFLSILNQNISFYSHTTSKLTEKQLKKQSLPEFLRLGHVSNSFHLLLATLIFLLTGILSMEGSLLCTLNRKNTEHCRINTPHFTLNATHCIMHTAHWILYNRNGKFVTAQCTLHSEYFTLHTVHSQQSKPTTGIIHATKYSAWIQLPI